MIRDKILCVTEPPHVATQSSPSQNIDADSRYRSYFVGTFSLDTMEDSEDLFSVELLEQYNYTTDDNDTTECEFSEGEEHLKTVRLFLGTESQMFV